MTASRWCLFCGAVLAVPDRQSCPRCAARKAEQIDEMLREARRAWAPPKDDGQEGDHDPR